MSLSPQPQAITILDVRVDILTLDDLLRNICHLVRERRQAVIANANIHALNLASEYPWFRDFLNQAEIVFCDGVGVKFAAKVLGLPSLHRYTPPDWLPLLARMCSEKGFSVFLLGSQAGVAELAGKRLQNEFPHLEIAGTHHGMFDKDPASIENQHVIAQINSTQADILIVAFGMPLQEQWIRDNRAGLSTSVIIPVGGALDYLSGVRRRAPRWITDWGLEWLSRLILEPQRLWRRYLFGIPAFWARLLIWELRQRQIKPQK